jgi:hypothetical protein
MQPRSLPTRWYVSTRCYISSSFIGKSVHLLFRPTVYVVCFLLGNSPASEFYKPTFRNTISSIFIGKKVNNDMSAIKWSDCMPWEQVYQIDQFSDVRLSFQADLLPFCTWKSSCEKQPLYWIKGTSSPPPLPPLDLNTNGGYRATCSYVIC